MGSVKDLKILSNPKEDKPGRGRFFFSDRYSVFDYGVMPDKIEGKGKALCLVSAYFFEKAEKMGFKTHYLGLVEEGKICRLNELSEAVDTMEVKLYRVIKPIKNELGYDYSLIKNAKKNYLIPLEIIYRNVLPEGSSVFKRLKNGSLSLSQIGLDHYPKPGEKLEKPILDVSTKLESEDRYITWEEAKEISGLSDDELNNLKSLTLEMDNIISLEVEKLGIENLDGKFEFALDENRELVFIDAIGTPDECRFSINSVQISKEVIRKYYRKTDWYKTIEKLKSLDNNWREKAKPPKLPADLLNVVSNMYKAFCNEVTGIKFFDVDKLSKVVKELLEVVEKYDI